MQKKKREGEGGKILHSMVPAEICNNKHRYKYIFFSCCCTHFCGFNVRHKCGFKITRGVTAIKISSMCLNWPLGFLAEWPAVWVTWVSRQHPNHQRAFCSQVAGRGGERRGWALSRQRNPHLEDFLGVGTSRYQWVQPLYITFSS